ncbi:MAG: esterase-like activity of phytase family protein [Deltaproteobacteria bacterium]|nr:esterase-like activity of phytase family protein [Deltaproteobacteria bacterium]
MALSLAGVLAAADGFASRFTVTAIPVALEPGNSSVTRVGRLTFLSGFELSSDNKRFGGLSGLTVSPDGTRLRAVSDRGYWVTAALTHDSEGRVVALDSWRDAALLTPAGKRTGLYEHDAEGLARDSNGSFLVSFEGKHRIWRYPAQPGAFPKPVATPRDLRRAPVNGGVEGIAVLSDGTLLGITEKHANRDGSLKGWFMKARTAHEFAYLPADGYSPTGVAATPGGDVLLLERSFDLLRMRVRVVRLPAERLRQARRKPGTRVRGEVMADLKRPLSVDNFEGLALRRDNAGRTLLYMVSDDNFLPLQRTLLLQFRVIDDL